MTRAALGGVFTHVIARAWHVVPIAMTLALFLALILAIASTYVGRARSPYNTCYGINGRAVSCDALEALR